ncbi:MAG: aspartyl/glutamyl-tRNA(Asn/Gln) amidotransferase subunit B [Candidatus Parcubacteria bacterium]|nr:MAG: aspartyl/glutamyl-tRNA(Asn/Gln) amidotransferase subunit B [Candidatus Parcubacteria bacterium]
MSDLKAKIGLEIHLELQTKTKLFCSCRNDPEESAPNVNICPVCTGQPGVLPVINKQAVIYACSLAKALKMKINQKSFFARKHYFYPDLPKNYQISQYELPLAINGEALVITEDINKKIRIRRLHLEEDTASNIHKENYSLVNFNRAGVPLVEIVTEPDFNSALEVENFCEHLVLLIRSLGISGAEAEKGEIRFEANISVGKGDELGVKTEIKNVAKIQSLKEAINYEIERQIDCISKGEKIIQETRGWDEIRKITFSQRQKEEAEDYRYFPEPDLPPLVINEEIINDLIEVETPWDKKIRFIKEYDLGFYEVNILIKNQGLADFFEESFSELVESISDKETSKKLIINYLINDILGLIQKYNLKLTLDKITPHEFAHLMKNFYFNKISSKIVKEILERAIKGEGKIEDILRKKEKITDVELLSSMIEEIIKENPKTVDDYRSGKKESFEYLIGQLMKKTEGRADPQLIRQLIKDKLQFY